MVRRKGVTLNRARRRTEAKERARKARERERRARAVAREKAREAARKAAAKEREKSRALARKLELRESRAAKRLLERLLKKEPSAAALARKVGVSPSTIRRWRRMAITPPNAGTILAMYEVAERERAKKAKLERDELLELLSLSGERGKLPDVRTGEGTRSGKQIKGYRWTKRIERELSSEVIADIVRWVENLRQRSRAFDLWQIVMPTTQLALSSRVPFEPTTTGTDDSNYKTVEYLVQVDHPKAGNLAVNLPMTTPRGKKDAILRGLRQKLQGILDARVVRVWIHGVNVFNYRLRTKEESAAYESAKRRERERQKKRKQRRRK